MSKNADLLAKIRLLNLAKTDEEKAVAFDAVAEAAHVERRLTPEAEFRKMFAEQSHP